MESKLKQYINELRHFRDLWQVCYNPEDYDFPEWLLNQAADEIRLSGNGSIIDCLPKDITVEQALDILGKALDRLLEKEESLGPLTVKQASVRLGVSERKVYQLCKDGQIKHMKNPIRILPDELKRYMEWEQVDPTLEHLQ